MAVKIEGQRDPKRLVAEKRQVAVRAILAKHIGERVSKMSHADLVEVVEAIAQALGLADENGELIVLE